MIKRIKINLTPKDKQAAIESAIKSIDGPTLALMVAQLKQDGMTDRQVTALLKKYIKRIDQNMAGYINDCGYLQSRLKEAVFLILNE